MLLVTLARTAFGVYLVHPLFVILLERVGVTCLWPNVWIGIPLVSAIVVVSSFLVTTAIERIPVVCRVVGSRVRRWSPSRPAVDSPATTGGLPVPPVEPPARGAPLVLHPLFCAIHPIVFLYAHNLDEMPMGVVVLPLVLSVGLALLVWCLTAFALKSWVRAGLIVTAFWVTFFSYGHLYKLVEGMRIELFGSVIGPNKVLAPLVLLGLLYVVFISVWRRSNLVGLTRVLNVVTVCLLAWPGIAIGTHMLKASTRPSDGRSADPLASGSTPRVAKDRLPNIYYIILDAYARADVLRDTYGHENAPFIEYLASRGFHVANKARSNYCWTWLSLASSLNLRYVTDLGMDLGPEQTDHKPVIARLQDNLVFKLLRERGYKIASFASGFRMTEMKDCDRYLSPPWTLGEFQYQLLDTTVLGALSTGLTMAHRRHAHRQLNLFALENLSRACVPGSPTFVFAHMCMPHPPFVFGPEGQTCEPMPTNSHDLAWKRLWRRRYVDQLIYLNHRLRGVIDDILHNADRPTAIILQADHGPRSRFNRDGRGGPDIRECTSILYACYLCARKKTGLYNTMTPVNGLRIVLNECVGTSFPRLEDRSYYSSLRYPLKFVDVTEQQSWGQIP